MTEQSRDAAITAEWPGGAGSRRSYIVVYGITPLLIVVYRLYSGAVTRGAKRGESRYRQRALLIKWYYVRYD